MFGFFEPSEMLRSFEARGMFDCTSRTVSCARELTSLSMCYPQGDGFNTSLLEILHCAVPSVCVGVCIVEKINQETLSVVSGYVRWHGYVLPGTTLTEIMYVHQLYQQG